MRAVYCCFVFFSSAATTSAFYLPGVSPRSFQTGDTIPLNINSLTSYHRFIPVDYYKLPLCRPSSEEENEGGPQMISQNLGQTLLGNKIQSSDYVLKMRKDTFCQVLCQVTLTEEAESLLASLIQNGGYRHNWIVDNLPSAFSFRLSHEELQTRYSGGFPFGFINTANSKPFIYNHVNIHIRYHKPDPMTDLYRVVHFAVEPLSIKHQFQDGYQWDGVDPEGFEMPLSSCSKTEQTQRSIITSIQPVEEGETIIFTYDVIWSETDVDWARRWDIYLTEDHLIPDQIHWFTITNSLFFIIILSGVLANITARTLRREIENINTAITAAADESGAAVEFTGWMALRGDAFRPPQTCPLFFCVCIGNGVQIGICCFLAFLLSAIGFLNPSRRGSFLTCILVLYTISGVVNGYVSSRMYKTFNGDRCRLSTMLSALLVSGVTYTIFLSANIARLVTSDVAVSVPLAS
eukprot:scaffold14098_cov66-Cylindrotheca_fusiformis.AAC.2